MNRVPGLPVDPLGELYARLNTACNERAEYAAEVRHLRAVLPIIAAVCAIAGALVGAIIL